MLPFSPNPPFHKSLLAITFLYLLKACFQMKGEQEERKLDFVCGGKCYGSFTVLLCLPTLPVSIPQRLLFSDCIIVMLRVSLPFTAFIFSPKLILAHSLSFLISIFFSLQHDTSIVWEGLGGIWPPCEPWDRVRERERDPSME